MLTFWGKTGHSTCDGLSRRDFLKVGGLGVAGLSMPELLRQQAQAGVDPAHKAVIIVYLNGGASQLDMFDMKPDGPAEFRGEFKPGKSKAAGTTVCELLPKLAQLSDKYSIVNGLQWKKGSHGLDEASSGFYRVMPARPAIGAVVSKFTKSKGNGMPAWVSKAGDRGPAYLGPKHAAFTGKSGMMDDLRGGSISSDRAELLGKLDNLRREIDAQGELAATDNYTQTGLEMLSSTKIRDAFDLKKESAKVLAKYPKVNYGGTNLLLALRLAEAGVSCATTYGPGNGKWDTHKNNFKTLKTVLPQYDQGISAMITDLYDRGLDKNVMIAIYGEFGRTPRINKNAGRDHYPKAGFVQIVGGGLKMGMSVGDTGKRGDWDISRSKPYSIQNLIATMYHVLDIDPSIKLPDNFGRPQYLLEQREKIEELI